MRVVILRHHDEDDSRLIGDALEQRGAVLESVHVVKGEPLPDPAGADAVVILGATYSVRDRQETAWMTEELAWLRKVDSAGVPMLGICFGAQALSAAFGGDVERAPRQEIGWTVVQPSAGSPIEAGPWLEFHEDRCLPPAGAEILARNELAVQAFRIGPHLAVQFHPEVDAALLQAWIDHGADQAVGAVGLDAEKFVAETRAEEPAARVRAGRLVETWLAETGTDPAVVLTS
jgi:GMP synthase-like glutamine amidotransferase